MPKFSKAPAHPSPDSGEGVGVVWGERVRIAHSIWRKCVPHYLIHKSPIAGAFLRSKNAHNEFFMH